MALTDGLICQIYPVAGETEIKNIVDGSVFTGTGTPALVDEGAEKAWRLTTGTLLTNPIPSTLLNAGVDGSGTTTALRFKRVTAGTDNYLRFAGLTTSAGATNGGPHLTTFDGNTYRSRVASGLASVTTPVAVANGNILTLVCRTSTLAASSAAPNMDNSSIWQNRVGRVGTAPDAVGYGNLSNLTLTLAFLNCQTSAEFVLIDRADWNRPLTDAEAASVADDYRGVMPAAGSGTTPIAFTGTIPAQSATVGTPFSLNVSSYFSGTQTPFTYAIQSGTLPAGLSLSGSTISGTPTTAAGAVSIVVRGTDASSNTADSNSFTITVAAAGSPPSGTFTVGTITTTQTTASVPYTYSASDQTSIQYRIDGGTAVTASASPQSLAGLTASTTYGIEFRAVNSFGNGAWSTSAPFTTAAVPAVPSFTLTDLVNNAGTPIASTGSITVDVYNPSTGALVVRKTGLTSTAGADVVVSDAALAVGTTYNVFITIGTAIGAVKATAA